MSEDQKPQTSSEGSGSEQSEDFDTRLKRAQASSASGNLSGKTTLEDDGKGKAIKIGSELIAGVAVGGGIGFLIDSWLDTKPWFLIGGLFLGNAAGLWNIFRLTSGQKYKVGFERKETPDSEN